MEKKYTFLIHDSVNEMYLFNSLMFYTRSWLLSRRSRQRERLSASMLSICSSVCLSVAKMQKRDFLKNWAI